LARHFSDYDQFYVRLCEPNALTEYGGDGQNEEPYTTVSLQTPGELLIDIFTRLHGPSSSIAHYDGLRYFVYAKGLGNTGTGGVDMMLSVQLTMLSNLFTTFGVIGFATVNPRVKLGLVADDDRYARMADDFAGALDTVLVGDDAFMTATMHCRSTNNRAGVHGLIDLKALSPMIESRSKKPAAVATIVSNDVSVTVYDDVPVDLSSLEALVSMSTMAYRPSKFNMMSEPVDTLKSSFSAQGKKK
jgi:hypothetical protein